jgi:putative transposase
VAHETEYSRHSSCCNAKPGELLFTLTVMKSVRKSHQEINKVYFFTASIHEWKPLLSGSVHKDLITHYLRELSTKGLIKVYAFVIMPTHVHFIWEQLRKNGKETPQGSFMKYTAHEFLKKLKQAGESADYEVNAANKKHQIWQRDSLSIEIYSRAVAKQKLDYIHFNPVSSKWQLAKDDLDYFYSSARFYECGQDDFGFLYNLYEVFDS